MNSSNNSLKTPHKKWYSSLDKSSESWTISFLDTFTLLLAFFIVMAAQIGKHIDLLEASKTNLFAKDNSAESVVYPVKELRDDLEKLLKTEIQEQKVSFYESEYELRLQFPGSYFFNSAEAEVLDEGKSIIDRIIEVTKKLKHYDFKIDVEGHADNRPIISPFYPSNWELSAARAANIVRYFIESDFDPQKLKASGYGDTFPLLPNEDSEGNPIPENQNINRRVVIRLYY